MLRVVEDERALREMYTLARREATFFSICLSFIAVKLVSIVLGQYLIAINRPNCVMVAAFACLATCTLFNWLLIYGNWGFPKLGVAGSAWATNIALATETAILAVFVFSGSIGCHRRRRIDQLCNDAVPIRTQCTGPSSPRDCVRRRARARCRGLHA